MTLELCITIALAVAGWLFGFIKWWGEKKQSKLAEKAQSERDAVAKRLTEAQEKIAEQQDQLVQAARENADSVKLIAELQKDDSNRFIWEVSWDVGDLYRVTNKSRRTVHNVTVINDSPLVRDEEATAELMKPGDSIKFFYAPVWESDYMAEVSWTDEFGNEYSRPVNFKKQGSIDFME
ncbi:aminoacyltransferase [Corynebacterium aurimucosum]|nr:aminoacyltransferase [Corynebacterium aurimucosum]